MNKQNKITLEDTATMMKSSDYKERFRAEYYQTSIRCKKLQDMLNAWDAGALTFTPACPRSAYTSQLDAMCKYIAALEIRAAIEHIDL